MKMDYYKLNQMAALLTAGSVLGSSSLLTHISKASLYVDIHLWIHSNRCQFRRYKRILFYMRDIAVHIDYLFPHIPLSLLRKLSCFAKNSSP